MIEPIKKEDKKVEPTIKIVEKKLVSQWKESNKGEDNNNLDVRIMIVGIGGGGCNAINTMMEKKIASVYFSAINTDRQSLDDCTAELKVLLGNGTGAGGNPDVARDIAIAEIEKIQSLLNDVNLLFIAGGLGGGTTTGVAPIVGKAAREKGILTIAAVTLPYRHEGKERWHTAMAGLKNLREHVDSFILIPNERIKDTGEKDNRSIFEALQMPSDVWYKAISGVVELISRRGYINRDFEDVKNVLKDRGLCVMGTGLASGPDRATEAIQRAINDPLLADTPIESAKNILINVVGSDTGPHKLGEIEYYKIMDTIHQLINDDGKIFPGLARDNNLGENIKVSIIATGLDEVYDVSRLQPQLLEDHRVGMKKDKAFKFPLSSKEEKFFDNTFKVSSTMKNILKNEGESELQGYLFTKRFEDKNKKDE